MGGWVGGWVGRWVGGLTVLPELHVLAVAATNVRCGLGGWVGGWVGGWLGGWVVD